MKLAQVISYQLLVIKSDTTTLSSRDSLKGYSPGACYSRGHHIECARCANIVSLLRHDAESSPRWLYYFGLYWRAAEWWAHGDAYTRFRDVDFAAAAQIRRALPGHNHDDITAAPGLSCRHFRRVTESPPPRIITDDSRALLGHLLWAVSPPWRQAVTPQSMIDISADGDVCLAEEATRWDTKSFEGGT